MHDATNDKAARRAARQMQRQPFLHPQMSDQPPLGEKVRRQLHRTAEPRPYHRRPDSSVQTLDALVAVDLPHPVHGVLVLVLRPDGQERRVRLQARLDQEERRPRTCAQDAGRGAREDVDAQRLHVGVAEDGCRGAFAERFVEA